MQIDQRKHRFDISKNFFLRFFFWNRKLSMFWDTKKNIHIFWFSKKYSYKICFLRYRNGVFVDRFAFKYCICFNYWILKKLIFLNRDSKFWVCPLISKILIVESRDSNFWYDVALIMVMKISWACHKEKSTPSSSKWRFSCFSGGI